jgi:DNA-binding transcriptional regulator YhcF (GntR family)
MARVQFNNRDPIYLQVIAYYQKQLVSGALSSGEELPSRREIARQLSINPNTVQRAFSEMEERGWIYTEPNRPSRVTSDIGILNQMKQDYVKNAVKEFVHSIQTIDISYKEVSELISQEWDKQNKDNGGKHND